MNEFFAPNNGMTPQQLAADDKRIKGCEAQASAASAQQPSTAPNGNSVLTGLFNAGVTMYRTEKALSGVVGFIQGLVVRPIVNGIQKEAAYSATLNACLNPGSYMNGVGMVW